MKRFLMILLALIMTFSIASASGIDLSQLTFDELVDLREQLNLAIWNSAEWQEVTVPQGVWEVGKDIPAGHWSIRVAAENSSCVIHYYEEYDFANNFPTIGTQGFMEFLYSPDKQEPDGSRLTVIDIDMQNGWYFICKSNVIFSPFTGKPDLGFK